MGGIWKRRRMHTKFQSENLKGKDHLEGSGIDVRMMDLKEVGYEDVD
jgi:hypothetical protein